jgi:hypothetical protein
METQQNNSCLICGKEGQLNRGLCSTHHSRYYKEVRGMTKEQKARYDEELIERGFLLPLQKRGPKVADNPFANIADELFTAETRPKYQPSRRRKKKAARKKKKGS